MKTILENETFWPVWEDSIFLIGFLLFKKTHPALLGYADMEGLLHTALETGTTEPPSPTDLPQKMP